MENLKTFKSLNLEDDVAESLEKAGFVSLTPIQQLTYEIIRDGKDILGEAPTGTGKTAAYFIPSIDKIEKDLEKVQILILVPTRELALQSKVEIDKLSDRVKYIR